MVEEIPVLVEEDLDERERFLAERKKGVGGSDVASVFNVGYGCRRRLWYDKSNIAPDYDQEENDYMLLGKALEPFFAEKFHRKTGMNVMIRPEPIVHPLFPEMRVNVDRSIMSDENREDESSEGVLEIKSVGRGPFYRIKREGLPEDYILQQQHAIEVVGANTGTTSWGYFAIGNRDNGDLMYWRVERDPAMAARIIEEVPRFWQEVQSGIPPMRLEPDDNRCQRCAWRNSCQGNALIQIVEARGDKLERDETLAPLADEYLTRKALFDEAEALIEETREQLKTEFGDREAIQAGGHKMYYRPQVSQRGDFKELALAYEEMRTFIRSAAEDPERLQGLPLLKDRFLPAESYKRPSPSRPFRFYRSPDC